MNNAAMAVAQPEKAVEADINVAPNDHIASEKRGSVITRAKAATDKEHKMGLFEGIRLYPKAIGWSMLISLCIAMEGFDLCLLNTFCRLMLPV